MAILVTGGSTGIGRAIAVRFARDGNDVFVNYNSNDEAAAETAGMIAERGGTAHLLKADVGSPEAVAAMLNEVREKVDQLDQIVHCAAKPVKGSLLDADRDEIAKSVAVNGMALIDVVREALPIMVRGSSVFFVSSRGGRTVVPNYGPMGIPKALGDHIIRYLAVDLAARGIRANIVAPGALETPAFRAVFPDNYAERLAASAAANPSGRALEFDDVAAVVEHLAGPEFSMVQGQYFAIDGGITL
jgi:NAD(P)-dependent dehydrogenase (short-subunit alcohol dehydrogenase family)